MKQKVTCSELSVESDSFMIAAHKERLALKQNWNPRLRVLFNKSPAEIHVKQEFRALWY